MLEESGLPYLASPTPDTVLGSVFCPEDLFLCLLVAARPTIMVCKAWVVSGGPAMGGNGSFTETDTGLGLSSIRLPGEFF